MVNTQIVMSDLWIPADRGVRAIDENQGEMVPIYTSGFFAGYGVVCREGGILRSRLFLLIVVQKRQRLRVAVGAVGPIVGLACLQLVHLRKPLGHWLQLLVERLLAVLVEVCHHASLAAGRPGSQSSLELFHLVEQSHAGLIGPLPNYVFYPHARLRVLRGLRAAVRADVDSVS